MSSMVPQAAEDSTAFILQVVGGLQTQGGDQRLGKNHRCDQGDHANCGESSFPHTCLCKVVGTGAVFWTSFSAA